MGVNDAPTPRDVLGMPTLGTRSDDVMLASRANDMDYDQVLLALDAPTALKIVASGQVVDVAVLDIGLPVMNGYELAERLRRREEEEGRRMRIVALSGYGQERDMAQARQSGFDAYLVKPVDLDLLTRAIAGSESPA